MDTASARIVRPLPLDSENIVFRYGLELLRKSRGRGVPSEPGVEDREMGSGVTWKWAALMCYKGAMAVWAGCFNSRMGGFNAGLNNISERASVLSPFEQLTGASASVLVTGGSVI